MNSIRMMMLGVLMAVVSFSYSTAQEVKQKAKPFIGIHMVDSVDDSGVRVVKVVPESPAGSLLQVNDVILKIDDNAIGDRTDIQQHMEKYAVEDIVTLTVRRNENEVAVEVKLGARPNQDSSITFKPTKILSADRMEITADLYENVGKNNAPFIVLCHQAGWSRGEYREIGPKLNQLGFDCVAIDQRSGNEVNEVVNRTSKRAEAEGKETGFVDAEQDMIAALKWAREKKPESKIILWGSSYSAALSLRIAGEHPELVDGVLAFAPGEYFVRFGKPENWIASSAKKIEAPAFITSAKNELPRWEAIFDAIPGENKSKFVPETKGNHGSRALWAEFDDSKAYWENVEAFLKQFN